MPPPAPIGGTGDTTPGIGWKPIEECLLPSDVGESFPPPRMIWATSKLSRSSPVSSRSPCCRTDCLLSDPWRLNERMAISSSDSESSPPPPRIEAASDLASERPSSAWFPSRTGMNRSSRNWSTSLAWLGTRTRFTWLAIEGASEVSDMALDRLYLPPFTYLGWPCSFLPPAFPFCFPPLPLTLPMLLAPGPPPTAPKSRSVWLLALDEDLLIGDDLSRSGWLKYL